MSSENGVELYAGRKQQVRSQASLHQAAEGDGRRHRVTDTGAKEAFERAGWVIREGSSGEFVGEAGR